MAHSLKPCSAFIITIFIFFSVSTAIPNALNPRPFKKIYAFGDSFTDTGNTRTATGPTGFAHVSNPPYGITYFHRPTNRYSDGRLNNLTLDITPESIQTQLLWFNKFLESQGCKKSNQSGPECKAALADALFWVGEIGVNDYAYTLGSSVSGDTIRKLAMDSFTEFLQALLKKGAKYVVVQALPTTGCLPLAMYLAPQDDRDDIGCVKSVNNQSYTHNAALQAKLQQLRQKFPQAVIVYADYWNAFHTVMKSPEKYGFKEPFKACCGSGEPPYNFGVSAACGTPSATACPNPSQYVNWDGVHLTEAMYKVMSDMFLNGTYSHPSFNYLLGNKQRQG
ncbi:hypothetical protein Patl1_18222 [Pistacia atlantica]|uniref:Uncharacterized protein n=1 Tax=Pistacia atlantica TaxID=434234 RepID=A0ACC1BYM0_9ROSI|nr:hypothetical protein Patl1_18222 [Pistacia atlantica]